MHKNLTIIGLVTNIAVLPPAPPRLRLVQPGFFLMSVALVRSNIIEPGSLRAKRTPAGAKTKTDFI